MSSNVAFKLEEVTPLEFHAGQLNTADDIVRAQVAHSIRLALPQAMPYSQNDDTVLLVCGGPSLNSTTPDLVQSYWRGGKVVTVNGSYNWCIERNIKPSATVVLDAREFNKRFIEPAVVGCRYLLASQCHPATFAAARGRDVILWHALSTGDDELAMLDRYYGKKGEGEQTVRNHWPVTFGTTVGLRAISLLRMLGYKRFEIFGLDSCWLDLAHHGYAQPENDGEDRFNVWTRPEGRDDLAQRFICSPWQAKQADDFLQLIKERGELFQLFVHGPGLIATMIRTGAELERESQP
jgi:6-hydroxymethylpterin diphosphokinase MptE-like